MFIPFLAAILLTSAGFAGGVFQAAKYAPPDVHCYVHVDGAAKIRRTLTGRPIERGLHALLHVQATHDAWQGLARRLDISEKKLFDDYFGRSLTVLVRRRGERLHWTLLSEVDRETFDRFQRRVCRARGPLLEPGIPVWEMPRHRLWVAYRSPLLVVGPKDNAGLFKEVLARLADSDVPTLVDADAIERARELGRADVGLFLRHEPPMGGWSAAGFSVRRDCIKLKHCSTFKHSPLPPPGDEQHIDISVLRRFDPGSVPFVLVQPANTTAPMMGGFISMLFPSAALDQDARANRGPRRLIVASDSSGRHVEADADPLAPTIAVAFEVNDAKQAGGELDDLICGFLSDLPRAAKLLGLKEINSQPPAICKGQPGAKREVELQDVAKVFFENTVLRPLANDATLHWRVAESEEDAWQVICTDSAFLDHVSNSLETTKDIRSRKHAATGAGCLSGRALATYLHRWANRADTILPAEHAPGFRRGIETFADVADGFDCIRWKIDQPQPSQLESQIFMHLSPADSAQR